MNELIAATISLDQGLQIVRKAHDASWQTGTGEPTPEQAKEMRAGSDQVLYAVRAIVKGCPSWCCDP